MDGSQGCIYCINQHFTAISHRVYIQSAARCLYRKSGRESCPPCLWRRRPSHLCWVSSLLAAIGAAVCGGVDSWGCLNISFYIFLRNAWWNEKNGEQFRIKPGEMKWTEWIWQSWIIRDLINYQQWPQVDTGWLLILKMLANHGQPVLGWKRPEEADWTGLWWKKCSVFVLVRDFIGFGHIMMRHTLMDPQRPIYDAV